MKEVLGKDYRTVLIQIAADLSEEQCKELVFYCRDDVPGKYDLSTSCLQIFDCLEHSQKISWEDLSYLVGFMRTIRRKDLVIKIAGFELKRELLIYAWKGHTTGSYPSASSVGHYLSEMMALAQERDEVGGLIYSLLKSGEKGYSILEAVTSSLLATDVPTNGRTDGNWSNFALLVAIAAEIVLVASKMKSRDQHYKYAVKLATELGDCLSKKLEKLGTWEYFYQFVGERYESLCHQHADPESYPGLSWQMELTDMVKKLKETIFY